MLYCPTPTHPPTHPPHPAGINLPAEELVGKLPGEGDKRRLRAYISNVATWAGARRRGVARRLMREAAAEAAAAGVQHLYGARGGGGVGWGGGWRGGLLLLLLRMLVWERVLLRMLWFGSVCDQPATSTSARLPSPPRFPLFPVPPQCTWRRATSRRRRSTSAAVLMWSRKRARGTRARRTATAACSCTVSSSRQLGSRQAGRRRAKQPGRQVLSLGVDTLKGASAW